MNKSIHELVDEEILQKADIRTTAVDELLDNEIREIIRQKNAINANYDDLEKQESNLDRTLQVLISNKNISRFQIIDQLVDQISMQLDINEIHELNYKEITPTDKWKPRVSNKSETPLAFAERVYGKLRGITLADIGKIDKKLYKAIENWISHHGCPSSFRIPKKKDLGVITSPSNYHLYVYRRINAHIVQSSRK